MKKTHECPAIRVAMMPCHTNGRGDIFGGVIMSQVDIAGAVTAHHVCENRLVTRVCTVEFIRPVLVNDILTLWGRLEKIGNTSITVKVEVEVERAGQLIKVGEAALVFVAVGADRKPTPVKMRDKVSGSCCKRQRRSTGKAATPAKRAAKPRSR